MTDIINHPPHYAEGFSNGAEVIDITENLNFNRGNAVKYIARAGKKNPDTEVEDLRKAVWYLNRELSRLGHTEAANELGDFGAVPRPARVWDDWAYVPEGVTYKGTDGGTYVNVSGVRYLSWNGAPDTQSEWDDHDMELIAPFTEVIA